MLVLFRGGIRKSVGKVESVLNLLQFREHLLGFEAPFFTFGVDTTYWSVGFYEEDAQSDVR